MLHCLLASGRFLSSNGSSTSTHATFSSFVPRIFCLAKQDTDCMLSQWTISSHRTRSVCVANPEKSTPEEAIQDRSHLKSAGWLSTSERGDKKRTAERAGKVRWGKGRNRNKLSEQGLYREKERKKKREKESEGWKDRKMAWEAERERGGGGGGEREGREGWWGWNERRKIWRLTLGVNLTAYHFRLSLNSRLW